MFYFHLPFFVFLADPEELCDSERPGLSTCQSSGAESHDALHRRAQAAEERACRSEEALARAMDDLHKLKSVTLRCLFESSLFFSLSLSQCTCFKYNIDT